MPSVLRNNNLLTFHSGAISFESWIFSHFISSQRIAASLGIAHCTPLSPQSASFHLISCQLISCLLITSLLCSHLLTLSHIFSADLSSSHLISARLTSLSDFRSSQLFSGTKPAPKPDLGVKATKSAILKAS